MRVGATEKTFFDCWHPDADKLFNVTSSLRKVCWELHDAESRLEDKVAYSTNDANFPFRIQTSSSFNVTSLSSQTSINEIYSKWWMQCRVTHFG